MTSDSMRNDDRRPAYIIHVCCALLLLLFTWSYWPTIKGMVAIWGSNPDYSHGYFVLPVALWLLWLRRESFPSELRPAWAGLLLIAMAAAIRIFAARIYLPRLDGWTMPLWLAGVVWVWGGWRLLRWSAPCLAFLWFMMPLPGTVEQLLSGPLQHFATMVSTWGLQCLGQPALAEGTTILLDEHVLEVERACSGLRIVYGISALAVGYVLVFRRSRWTTVVLLASVLPVALVANAFRVTITGLMYRYASDELARRFSHDFAGFAVIPLAVFLFWGIATCWDNLARRFKQDRARTMTALTGYAVVCGVLLIAVYFWHAYQERRASAGLLTRATALEEQEDWESAAEYMSRYLRVCPDDHEVLARLAQTYDEFAAGLGQRLRVFELYRQAAEALPERTDLRLRHAELALEMQRYVEASEIAQGLSSLDDDSRAAAARIDALTIVGRLAADGEIADQLTWQQHAVPSLSEAVRLNPHDIGLAVRLADIYRNRLDDAQQPDRLAKADQAIEGMLSANPQLPAAWLARYRYRLAHLTPGSPGDQVPAEIEADLDRAIELGRENPAVESIDVLLVAGTRAERREETEQARAFYDRARQIQPTDYRGYLALGQLQASADTPDARQEAVRVWRDGLANADGAELALKPPLAAVLFLLGQADAAERELQELEQLLPFLREPQRSSVDLSISMIRGEAQALAGQIRQAASSIRQQLDSLPPPTSSRRSSTQFASAWLRLADIYGQIGVYDQAATAIERAGDLDPSIPLWRQKAAAAWELAGRLDTAISYYGQVANQDSSQPELWLALARAHLQSELRQAKDRRNWQPFQLALQQAMKLGADPVAVILLSAEYALTQGTPDSTQRSVGIINKGLQEQPESSRLWRALAAAHEHGGEFDEALQAAAEFEQRTSEPLDALRLRAGILWRAGKSQQAKQTLQEGLTSLQDPERQQELQRLIIQLELSIGNRQQAIDQLQALARDRPRDVELARQMAELALNERDWTALIGYEKRLRDIEGEDGTLWRLLRASRLLQQVTDVRDQQFKEILRLVDEIETRRPNWPSLYTLRGQIATRQGSSQDAILAYQEALRLGNRSVRTAVALVELLTQQRRFREAEQLVNQFRQDVSHSSRLASLATNVYLQQGESEEALRLAEDWVQQRPDDPQGHIRLGRTLLLTTAPDSPSAAEANSRAEQAFRRAIELDPNDLVGWSSLFSYRARVEDRHAAYEVFDELAEQQQIPPAQRALTLAQLFEALQDSYRAARQYRKAVRLADDDDKVGVLERAAQFFRNLDPTQAEDYCRQILQRVPDSPTALTTLIAILAEQPGESSLREAFQLLDKSRAVTSISVQQRLEAGLLRRRDAPGDRRREIQILEELVSVSRTPVAQDQLRLAQAYEQEGRLPRAVQILAALARKPGAPTTHTVAYLEFLQRNGQAEPAFLKRAKRELARLQRDPENTPHLLLALQQGIRAAKQDLALDDSALQPQIRQHVDRIVQTLRRSPSGVAENRIEGLLITLLREDCVQEAVRICRLTPPLLDADQALWRLVVALVRSSASQEAFDNCEPIVRDLLQASPDNPQVLYAAGFFYYSQQKNEQGIALLRRALAAAPDRNDLMNMLAFALATHGERLAEALQLIDKAISAAGPIAQFLDTKAVVMLRQGKVESARDILQETLDASPADPLIWLHLAVALHKLGDVSEARDAWLLARRLNITGAPQSPLDRHMAEEMAIQFDP